MNRVCLLPLLRYTGIVVLAVALLCVGRAAAAPAKAKAVKKTVGIVFFAAHDCPRCESVKDLMKVLKVRYPLRVKDFDVDKEADYSLFKRIEAIHSADKFAVPLVMVGESILMGEEEITGKLEKTVRYPRSVWWLTFPLPGVRPRNKDRGETCGRLSQLRARQTARSDR